MFIYIQPYYVCMYVCVSTWIIFRKPYFRTFVKFKPKPIQPLEYINLHLGTLSFRKQQSFHFTNNMYILQFSVAVIDLPKRNTNSIRVKSIQKVYMLKMLILLLQLKINVFWINNYNQSINIGIFYYHLLIFSATHHGILLDLSM